MSMDLKDRLPSYPYQKLDPSMKSLNTYLELLEPWFIFHGNLDKAYLMLQASLSDEAQNLIQHLLKGNQNGTHLFAAIKVSFQLNAADLITLQRQLINRKMKPREP
ncbi:hypothetical protein M427DRAFT_61018, partial [Gonapodya prolifera JEL478]